MKTDREKNFILLCGKKNLR